MSFLATVSIGLRLRFQRVRHALSSRAFSEASELGFPHNRSSCRSGRLRECLAILLKLSLLVSKMKADLSSLQALPS